MQTRKADSALASKEQLPVPASQEANEKKKRDNTKLSSPARSRDKAGDKPGSGSTSKREAEQLSGSNDADGSGGGTGGAHAASLHKGTVQVTSSSTAAAGLEKPNEFSRPLDTAGLDIIELVHKKAKSDGPIFEREEILSHKVAPGASRAPDDAAAVRSSKDAREGKSDRQHKGPPQSSSTSNSERENFVVSSSGRRNASSASTKLLSDRWKSTDDESKPAKSRYIKDRGTDRGVQDRNGLSSSHDGANALKESHSKSSGRNISPPAQRSDATRDKERRSQRDEPVPPQRPSIQERLGRIAGGTVAPASVPTSTQVEDLRHGLNRRARERTTGGGHAERLDRAGQATDRSSARRGPAEESHDRLPDGASKSQAHARPKSKTPDFSLRPDKGRYEEWMNDDPLITPKGNRYFLHDDRDSYDGRRAFRGRGGYNRSRQNYDRGDFGGGGGGADSSGAWQHDMFDQVEGSVGDSDGSKAREK